jgi:hypothetical protein
VKLTADKNVCPGCSEPFNSTFAFDKHRTGPFGRTAPDGTYLPAARRCKTADEMQAAGMGRNAKGFWVSEVFEGRTLGRVAVA